jgi:hypothetical protein
MAVCLPYGLADFELKDDQHGPRPVPKTKQIINQGLRCAIVSPKLYL